MSCFAHTSCNTTSLPNGTCFSNRDCPLGSCIAGRCQIDRAPADAGASAGASDAQPGPAPSPQPGHLDAGPGTDAHAGIDAQPNMSMSCNQDTDCTPGAPDQICVQHACTLGCGNGGQPCGSGSVCNTRTGRCEHVGGACGADNDCGPPAHVCESRQCVPGCGMLGGVQCPGTACDTSTGRCTGTLPDAGGSPPDTGSPADDSGSPPDDSGTSPDSGVPPADSGTGNPDATPSMDAQPSSGLTIAQVLANPTLYVDTTITLPSEVTVAVSMPVSGAASATFYLQDPGATGPGLSVYKGPRDTTPVPNIGDMISVTGRLSYYDGALQLASSSRYAVTLQTTINASGGSAAGGAYPPAGAPLSAANMSDYSNTLSNPHPEQVGNVLVFGGQLSVTNSAAFVRTDRDGGVHVEGFEINGSLWIDDTFIYKDCIAPLDGGVLNLPTGIRGVWDRYQDYYAGTTANPAPTVPVLYPMSCADLMP